MGAQWMNKIENLLLLIFMYNLLRGNSGYAFITLVIYGILKYPYFIIFAK